MNIIGLEPCVGKSPFAYVDVAFYLNWLQEKMDFEGMDL